MFNEKSHAYIIAKYYCYLKENNRLDIFVKATQTYGQQRGHRMALRALRNNDSLSFESYFRYSEWTTTDTVKALNEHNQSIILQKEPDVVRQINVCPWHTQFKQMNLIECGSLYCKYIDISICRGFNPDLIYEVQCTLNESNYCLHKQLNVKCDIDQIKSYTEGIKDFKYHCAHAYFTFKEIIDETLNNDIPDLVLKDIENEYGNEFIDILRSYSCTNFNTI